MLDLVTAIGFVDVFHRGRTAPILLDAEREDGSAVQVVAKLSASSCEPGGLVREAFSSLLAADLGLPVPEPFLVQFPDGFSDLLPPEHAALKQVVAKSLSPTFGTQYFHGLSVYTESMDLPSALLDCATHVVAFDGAVRNSDRGGPKPNCLTDHKSKLLIFDHELALVDDPFLGTVFNPNPWEQGGMNALDNPMRRHVLLAATRGKGGDLAQLQSKWDDLTPARFSEYKNAIPVAWDPDSVVSDGIVSYLCEVRENLPGLFAEAKRVLQ